MRSTPLAALVARLRSLAGPFAPTPLGRRAWSVVAGYAFFATLWILFSDRALAAFASDRAELLRWSSWKGLAFVAATSFLLLVLVRRALEAFAQSDSALRREQRFTEAMLESLPGVLYLYDEDGRFLRWNRSFERVTGYTAAEIARMHPREFFTPADQPPALAAIAEVFAQGAAHAELPFRIKNGTTIPYFFTGRRVEFDGRPCLVGVGIDVSEPRAARARLAEHAALLRIAGQTARLGGWAIDLPEHRLHWSDEVRLMHEIPPGHQPTLAEGVGMYAPEHREEIQRLMARLERDGTPYDVELQKITATGRRLWVRTMGEAVRDASGRIVRLQGAFQDVTERKEADARIREQAALLDKAQDAILVRDLDDRIRYWNKSAERLYGWTAEEARGRVVTELLYPDSTLYQAARSAVMERGEWVGEIEQRTRSGAMVVVEGRWTLVRNDRGEPASVLAINTDITLRKQLERQFLRAQRMESIGTLAGGIAHDLNNVLAPIMMSIELLRPAVHDREGRETLDLIGTSARRGAEMIRQVLSFARGVEGRRVAVHAAEEVRHVVAIANDTFPKSIRVVQRVHGDLWPLEADPTQLQQVLLNLCVNARDALPAGGTITIGAENFIVDEPYAAMNLDARPGPYVRLEVEDDGAGIPAAIIDKIFDPFFTTKEFGKGTGLGLATSQAIVKSHGGFLRVHSEVGRGTHFRVYLPAHPDSIPPAEPPESEPVARGHGETILVVDDEVPVRAVTRRTLETFGYRVLLAADGVEALEQFLLHRDTIALVVTDMMMPVMDGPALIKRLHDIAPEVRIIGVSGIASQSGASLAEAGGVTLFLPKPFTATTLLRAIQRALAAPR